MKLNPVLLLIAGFATTFFPACQSGNQNASGNQQFLDLSGMDTTVQPGNNFFLYANGNWLQHTDIPPSQTGWGSFYIVRDNVLTDLREILDSVLNDPHLAPGSIDKKVSDLYASAMDTTAIEKAGIHPLDGDLKRIDAISSPGGIIREVVMEHKEGDGALFSFYSGQDDKNSKVVMAHFDQGGLGLPDKDYYFKNDSITQQIRTAYLQYIAKILMLAGQDSSKANSNARNILKLETNLAKVSKSPVELRDPEANYHKLSLDEMDKITPGLNWNILLQLLGVKQDTILVGQPDFYKGLNVFLKSLPLEDWKNYLRFHLINNFAGYLNSPYEEANFEFYSQTLNGQKVQKERWKRMCSMVDHELGDGLGQLYVKRFFPPEAKQRMIDLVNNLQKTYEDRIRNVDWMDDSTKLKAIEKLAAFTKKIGYPDKWKDYSSVRIVRDSFINNIKACNVYRYNWMIAKIGKPVDKTEWGMTPPTVNAYYNPTMNEIVFPAGILQPPFFFKDADDAVNYGAIGAVIGHEMTHGFDDQGRLYDANGNLHNWWTSEDSAKFMQKAQLVIQQYDNSVILDSLHVNGKLTLGENIADIGGLAIAYAAFKNTPEGKSNQLINGFTPDQRFFLSFAQIWRVKNTDKMARLRLQVDPHSPEMYRVNNPVSNMVAFYNAFDVKPGDKMYRPDSLRVHIW
jgi:putative endopeptidase